MDGSLNGRLSFLRKAESHMLPDVQAAISASQAQEGKLLFHRLASGKLFYM